MPKGNFEEKAGSALFFFLVLSAVAILLSFWLGLAWLNSIFIFVASLIASFFLAKKFPLKEKIPLKILLLALLIFSMEVYPEIILHPGYQASSDPVETVMLRVLDGKIPATYAPHSNIKFTYQFSFQLLVKIFYDLIPIAKDYTFLWFFGALFGAIQLILIYLLAKNFFGSEPAGFFSALLFLGSKIVFQNMYYGIFPWMIATVFFLAAAVMLERKNSLFYLFLPLIFLSHPGVALYSLIFFLLFAFYEKIPLKQVLLSISALALALPALVLIYPPLVMNIFSGHSFAVVALKDFLNNIISFLLFTGIMPALFLAIGLFYFSYKKKYPKKLIFVLALLFVSIAFFVLFFSLNSILSPKLMELVGISAILIGGLGAAQLWEHYLKSNPLLSKAFVVLVLAGCIFFFLSSPYLNYLRGNTKITPDEAHVAFEIEKIEPKLERAAFFSEGAAKMAELSNKIPFDVTAGVYLAIADFQAVRDAGFEEMLEKHKRFQRIIDSNCVSCIYDLNVEFVVINREFFNHRLQEEPVFSYKSFDVYELDGNK